MKSQPDIYKSFLNQYINREWKQDDGFKDDQIIKAENRLGITFSKSLREFYSTIGNVEELTKIHNKILRPESVYIEDGYLIFMEENQGVVSWGIKIEENSLPDPIIWQRNNTEFTWYSEELNMVKLLESMFNWYVNEEIIIKG
jgi:hypothetical protein